MSDSEKETLVYARVSTEQQNLESQEADAWEYCTDTLGVDPESIDVLSDTSTGSNTDRSGYDELVTRAESGEVERVVVREVSRIARNMRDLNATVGHLVDDNDVSVHIIDAGLKVGEEDDDGLFNDRLILQILGIAAELEHRLMKERTAAALATARREGKHVGRAPYGFEHDDDGYLVVKEDEYDKACLALEAVETLGWSVRRAARHSGVNRSTLRKILDDSDKRDRFTVGSTDKDLKAALKEVNED